MKFFLEKPPAQNLKVLMNRLGYHQRADRQGQISYVKRFSGYDYPRFHLYINQSGDRFELNLHLDEKKASYAGQPRHVGDYGSQLVASELGRIVAVLS